MAANACGLAGPANFLRSPWQGQFGPVHNIEYGQIKYKISNCMEYRCFRKNSAHDVVKSVSCGFMKESPRCKYEPGEFPDCCPTDTDCYYYIPSALEYRFLPFENGKCIFNGEKVGVEQSTYEIKTCKRWTCYGKINSTHGKMRGASCGAVWAPPPCKVIPMGPVIERVLDYLVELAKTVVDFPDDLQGLSTKFEHV
ncbi:hypothetical protein MRX96_034851 [Rhipicephalus microplus]